MATRTTTTQHEPPRKSTNVKTVNGAPPDWNTITVNLNVPNVQEACDFYQTIGFELEQSLPGPDGTISWGLLHVGNSRIMVNSVYGPAPNAKRAKVEQKGPRGLGFGLHVFVPDVDTVHRTLVNQGLSPDTECRDEFWGDRCTYLADPFGYYWTFATHVRDVPPDEMIAAVAALHN